MKQKHASCLCAYVILLWAGGRWWGTAARWSSGAVSHRTPGIAGRNLRTTPKVTDHLRTVIANSLTAWVRVNGQISIYLSTHVIKLPGKSHPQRTLSNRVALATSVRCNRAELPKSVGPNDNLQPNRLTGSQARTVLDQ